MGRPHGLDQRRQMLGRDDVVVVEERDERPARGVDAGLSGRRPAARLRVIDADEREG